MPNKRFNITALAYDKRGRLLSVGKNSYIRTHRLQAHYANLSGRPAAIYLHAEIAALIKARGKVHKLVVTRYTADGEPANCAPCPACRLAIRDYGVQKVLHT